MAERWQEDKLFKYIWWDLEALVVYKWKKKTEMLNDLAENDNFKARKR